MGPRIGIGSFGEVRRESEDATVDHPALPCMKVCSDCRHEAASLPHCRSPRLQLSNHLANLRLLSTDA